MMHNELSAFLLTIGWTSQFSCENFPIG
jgi:hypothetical protein